MLYNKCTVYNCSGINLCKSFLKALPKAPHNASVTVQATYVHINWEPSPDAIKGSRLRYSVDCFRCKSSKYKECGGSCGPHVQYKPSKDNITSLTVRINGLASGSFFRFRVYTVSELNEQEKDRDKWKYVVIRAKTKGGSGQVIHHLLNYCTYRCTYCTVQCV